MRLPPRDAWCEKSVWGLLAANAYVLFGALFLGWDAGSILILYWAENVVIGGYTVLKVILARSPSMVGHAAKFGMVPFFVVHYGMFCMVHGFFVMTLTKWGSPMADSPAALLGAAFERGLAWPLAGLVVSHGISFVENYLLGKEYLAVAPQQAMMAPYGRIVLLHVAIVAGGASAIAAGSPVPFVALLVALKTAMDLWLHWKSHAKLRRTIRLGVSYGTGTGFHVHLSDEE